MRWSERCYCQSGHKSLRFTWSYGLTRESWTWIFTPCPFTTWQRRQGECKKQSSVRGWRKSSPDHNNYNPVSQVYFHSPLALHWLRGQEQQVYSDASSLFLPALKVKQFFSLPILCASIASGGGGQIQYILVLSLSLSLIVPSDWSSHSLTFSSSWSIVSEMDIVIFILLLLSFFNSR